MATVPDPQDPVARPRLILPGSVQSATRPKIVVPGVGLIDPDAMPEPPPVEADAHLITEPLVETRREPEIYLDDFLGDAGEDDYQPAATADPQQLATPVLLSPPPVQPRPLGPPADWKPLSVEPMKDYIDQQPIGEPADHVEPWQIPGQEESAEPVDLPVTFGEADNPPVEEPVVPRLQPAFVPAPGTARLAGQPDHAVPRTAAPAPHASKHHATAKAVDPGSGSLVPGWVMLLIGILIGLIGGVLVVAKTKASAKLGLLPTSQVNAHVLDILMEERAQTQAMLNEYYRNKRIDLTREMADFRTEQGRKAPENMTMEDFRDPEDESAAKSTEAKDGKDAEPDADKPENAPD